MPSGCPYDWGGLVQTYRGDLAGRSAQPGKSGGRAKTPCADAVAPAALHANAAGRAGAWQLQALLLHLIEQQPELADVVEAQMHRVRISQPGDASTPQQRRTPVDPNVFRRQVRSILRSLDRMRSSEA